VDWISFDSLVQEDRGVERHPEESVFHRGLLLFGMRVRVRVSEYADAWIA
jgi:hypothetical protein